MTTMTAPTGTADFDRTLPDNKILHPLNARRLAEPAFSCTRRRQIRRQILGVELFATLALAVSLLVAATAVSIGMARAQALPSLTAGSDAPVAVAVFFGVMAASMGGLTAVVAHAQPSLLVDHD
jgi:hypothetical protein